MQSKIFMSLSTVQATPHQNPSALPRSDPAEEVMPSPLLVQRAKFFGSRISHAGETSDSLQYCMGAPYNTGRGMKFPRVCSLPMLFRVSDSVFGSFR